MIGKKRYLLLTVVLLLASCSQLEGEITPPPEATEPPSLPQATETAAPPTPTAGPTETSVPTDESPEPTQEPPTAIPTEEITLGDPYPLLPVGYEISLEEVEMITRDIGWGLTKGQGGFYHILRTDDGGYQWREITPPQPLSARSSWLYPAVHFVDPEIGWASYSGTDLIWTTRNGGLSWQPSKLPYEALRWSLISSADQEHVWLFQFLDASMNHEYTSIVRTTNGGQSWDLVHDPYMESTIQGLYKTGISFASPQYGWLTRDYNVAAYLYLDITRDGGATWEQMELPPPSEDNDIFTDSNCFCALYDPSLSTPQKGTVRLSCKCSNDQGMIEKNFLYKTEDSGVTWTTSYIPEGKLHVISGQVLYLAGKDIYRSNDGGEEWDFVKSVNWEGQFSFINQDLLWAIAYDPANDVFALVKSTDGGKNFQIIEPELLPSLTLR